MLFRQLFGDQGLAAADLYQKRTVAENTLATTAARCHASEKVTSPNDLRPASGWKKRSGREVLAKGSSLLGSTAERGLSMPEQYPSTNAKLGAVIHGHDGATVWCTVTLLANDRCEIECDHVFRCTEEVEIHIRGMGAIRARVVSVDGRVMTARFIVDCPV